MALLSEGDGNRLSHRPCDQGRGNARIPQGRSLARPQVRVSAGRRVGRDVDPDVSVALPVGRFFLSLSSHLPLVATGLLRLPVAVGEGGGAVRKLGDNTMLGLGLRGSPRARCQCAATEIRDPPVLCSLCRSS